MDKMIIEAMGLLEQEASLLEIVRLVGAEALSASDRLALETARSIREDYLHQNAFHKVDTFTSIDKQYEMLLTILHFHKQAIEAIEAGAEISRIFKLPVREEIARAKYIPQEEIGKLSEIREQIDEQIRKLHTAVA
jgi:V/A-type H+-transporting ATPase subunit A